MGGRIEILVCATGHRPQSGTLPCLHLALTLQLTILLVVYRAIYAHVNKLNIPMIRRIMVKTSKGWVRPSGVSVRGSVRL